MSGGSFAANFRKAALLHGAFFLALFIQGWVLPSQRVIIPPSLRVDLVGLPDLTKQQMQEIAPAPVKEAEVEQPKEAAKPTTTPKEIADPKEMVIKSDKKADTAAQDRKKRMDAALRRTQALAKIEQSMIVKGNEVSKGSSTSSDAKVSGEADYYGRATDHLRLRWSLPIWLLRQNLSAAAEIWIDADGKLLRHRMSKTSGNEQFDQAVERAILESNPYPRPPTELVRSLNTDGILVRFPL